MRKKTLKIIIPILIVVIAVVTVILLIPRQTDFKNTYVGYNLKSGFSKELSDTDLASDVLEHMDIDCDFTFKFNPISYYGEGTVTYDEKKLYVNSNVEGSVNMLALTGNTGLTYSWLKLSKDTECFLLDDYKNDGLWIVFPKGDPTIEEIRDRVIELGYRHWFGI